jgi:IS30 family transposase
MHHARPLLEVPKNMHKCEIERVREQLRATGLSERAIGLECGMAPSTVNRFMRGECDTTASRFTALKACAERWLARGRQQCDAPRQG